jgi:hypothetical protein
LAILANVASPTGALELADVRAKAMSVDLEVIALEIRRAQDVTSAFDGLKGRADALYVTRTR